VTRAQTLRSLLLPGALSVVALAILISLGNWQMERLSWKENLIATAAKRVKEMPQPLPASAVSASLDLQKEEYRPYIVEGRFLHQHEAHVYTVLSDAKGTYSGMGYWVLTPLQRSDGRVVIINRGFVPPEMKNPASRKETQIEDVIRVTGLFRAPEQANYFTPANEPSKNVWYRRDPKTIANALGLQNVAPFMLDAVGDYRAGQLPQPNETRLTFTNNHLGYALTWYGLACTLIGVFAAFAWQRLRASRL
jgi:surfeit locus 1 family protein